MFLRATSSKTTKALLYNAARNNNARRTFLTASPVSNEEYDVCVIGGGPGGYVSAIKALRQLDPTGVTLEAVSDRVRTYLKARSDTIRQIVTSLTDPETSELLEPSSAAEGEGGAVVADNAEFASIPEGRRELIRQAFAGPEGNIFANLCARDALQGMLKGVRAMQCSADTLEQYCLRWRKFNCDDDPVDQIAVELWLEICLPAWRTRATSRTRSLRHESGASQEGSGGESQRK